MAKVTVVNIEKAIAEQVKCDEENCYFHPEHSKVAVIPCPDDHVIVVDTDAVHWTYASVDKEFDVALYKYHRHEDGSESGSIIPSHRVSAPIRELLEDDDFERTEEELGTFVRRFGQRIEDNYHILLDTLEKHGLNPKDYPRGARKASVQV
jgi:hypothetical protein